MTAKHKPHEHAALSDILARYVPDGRAQYLQLPDCRGLGLYLLNEDYPQHELSAEQAQALMNYPAYWAFCWASGVVLARYLLENPGWVEGRTVLDFGSGSGVAAIASAMAGAKRVIACDIDEDAQLASRVNAELNGVDVDLAADFNDVTDELDLILVADVLYDRENLPWLERFLQRAPEVLVADSRVRDFRFPGYERIAQYDSSTLPDLDESAEFRRVSLYRGG